MLGAERHVFSKLAKQGGGRSVSSWGVRTPSLRQHRRQMGYDPPKFKKARDLLMPVLHIRTEAGVETRRLDGTIRVGRHPDCGLQILDRNVSKEHFLLEPTAHGYALVDLGSLNGTFVNGVACHQRVELKHGDVITLGAVRVTYASDGPSIPVASRAPTEKPAMPEIGTQVDALHAFAPAADYALDPERLAADYERLRFAVELSNELSSERDLKHLLATLLRALFRHVRADRGVILLKDADGKLRPHVGMNTNGESTEVEVSTTILEHVTREKAAVLTHDAAHDFGATRGRSMILHHIRSAIVAPLIAEREVLGAVWLDAQSLGQFRHQDLLIATTLAHQASMFLANTRLTTRINEEVLARERFARTLSPNLAERVRSGALEVKQGGVFIPGCAVLNSDIRGFTGLTERTDAALMVAWLNEYFEAMVDVLFRHEGTLDKFMGDGILSLFGAPEAHADDAARAVSCAIEQVHVLRGLNEQRQGRGEPPLEAGFGIDTGPVIAGYVGSSRTLSYTVVGDPANTSARLCALAGPYEILVSEATYEALDGRVAATEMGPMKVKGKDQMVRVFRIDAAHGATDGRV